MAVASQANDMNVYLDRKQGRRGEEGEVMDINCCSNNHCKRNHLRRSMATMFPPMPFVPPPEKR